jgi:DNA polymerase-3 subunit epsilon
MIQELLPTTSVDEAEFSVIDVETTGLSAKTNRVIEVGLVKVRNYKIVERYESLINPGSYLPGFITQLTGITADDVENAPFFSDIVEDLKHFIGETIICGHNLSFDSSFIKYEFLRNGEEPLYNEQVCTLKLARRIFPDLRSKSLTSITKHLKLRNKSPHRALGDAEVTARALIKMIKSLKKESKVKTVDDLLKFQKSSASGKTVKIKESLREDISSLPNAPGVYYFINNRGKVIYVGKAKSLRDRIRSYFSSAAPKKAKKIITQAKSLKIEITNTELTALLSEAESIKKIKPRHDFDGNDYFGLFISRKKAEIVLEILDKTFSLRECTDKEFSKHKKCFLADIERCTAPCIPNINEDYKKELEKVYEFLYGMNQTALNRLLNKMKEYSELEKYEKAAEVKEVIDLILNQTHKTSLLSEPVNRANVLFEVSGQFDKDYILLINGKIFLKKINKNNVTHFDNAVDDFYNSTINYDFIPTDEDLEKIKITLNWLIKNRNKVRSFYLNNYSSKDELYSNISSFSSSNNSFRETTFDIKDLANV